MRGADGEIRIALAGDWGTGTDEAAKVAAEIEAFEPHYAIHLGDVYYVGDPVEVGANFLGVPTPAIPITSPANGRKYEGSFSLNGNHEMYARGFGYFDLILPKLGMRGSPRGQGQTAFASRTTTGELSPSIQATIPSACRSSSSSSSPAARCRRP